MPYTAAFLRQYEIDANLPVEKLVRLNTSTGGAVWILSDRPEVIAKYNSGELTGGTSLNPEAAPGGVYLVMLPDNNPGAAGQQTPGQILNPTLPPKTPQTPVVTPSTPITQPGTFIPGLFPSVPITPSVTSVPATIPPIDLYSTVQISNRTIDREYVKGTMRPLQQQELEFRNVTTNMNITVGIRSVPGVIFSPQTFPILALHVQKVLVSFDMAAIDALPEGLNNIITVVDISSDTILLQDAIQAAPAPQITPTAITPSTPVVPAIPVPIPIPTIPQVIAVPEVNVWNEERFYGNVHAESEAAIFGRTPFLRTIIPTINYRSGDDFPAPVVVRWTTKYNWQGGKILFSCHTDDGMRIYVDNQLAFNLWQDQPEIFDRFVVFKEKGIVDIRVEYYNIGGRGIASVVLSPTTGIVDGGVEIRQTPLIALPNSQIKRWFSAIQTDVYDINMTNYGPPPADWVEDTLGGGWYPRTDPYVGAHRSRFRL